LPASPPLHYTLPESGTQGLNAGFVQMSAVILHLLDTLAGTIIKPDDLSVFGGETMAKKIRCRVAGGCVVCMTCMYACPVQAITLIPDVSAVIDQEKCIGCCNCYESCQPGAIVREEIDE